MRGKHKNAAPDKNVRAIQRFPFTSHMATSDASISFKTGPIPPKTPHTTNTPTATSAHSFTTASTAIAMTTPWWRSFTSRFRVPNKIVNSASPAPTQNAAVLSDKVSEFANAPSDSVTDCNCNAMYGVVPTIAKIVTNTPKLFDLPNREEIRSAIDVTRCARPMRTNFRKIHHQPSKTRLGPR